MLRPSRIVEQRRGIPLFVQKGSSSCSVCGRPLTAHESVARGIGPVCVQKHYGPGLHPSGSPQSAHAGRRGKRKSLAELVKTRPVRADRPETSGIETTYVNTYEDGSKALWKINDFGSAESEFMAYEFSKSVGWDIVPETILPEGTKNVSAQRWVENSVMPYDLPEPELFAFRKNDRMLIMDTLLGNRDRHMDNVVIDAGGKQWAIDNNLAFGVGLPVPGGKRKYPNYTTIRKFTKGLRVTKEHAGLIGAAKDVARWGETQAYQDYVMQLARTHGFDVAEQFTENVIDLAEWSRKAKVI